MWDRTDRKMDHVNLAMDNIIGLKAPAKLLVQVPRSEPSLGPPGIFHVVVGLPPQEAVIRPVGEALVIWDSSRGKAEGSGRCSNQQQKWHEHGDVYPTNLSETNERTVPFYTFLIDVTPRLDFYHANLHLNWIPRDPGSGGWHFGRISREKLPPAMCIFQHIYYQWPESPKNRT